MEGAHDWATVFHHPMTRYATVQVIPSSESRSPYRNTRQAYHTTLTIQYSPTLSKATLHLSRAVFP